MVAELLPNATLLALLAFAPVPIAMPLTTDVVAPLPKAMELVAAADVTAVCPIAIDWAPLAVAPAKLPPLPPPMATDEAPVDTASFPRA
ncbi:hypothetical protein [Collimonas sp. PA-H2]|uniref:hypothetical protein n=1 Tax=Collimonas sp. PA-H2 TaxID=1881062 RepID=UPI00351526F9